MSSAQVSYDDFAKLDIRIGTIVSVEVVPNADKLLRLSVDLGEEEPRQIISGIREYFEDPEELVGRRCPFVVNLEPRTIRGYESQGMILACLRADTHRQAASTDLPAVTDRAQAGDTFALLIPHNEVPAGTKIK